ncbi:MAG: polyprenyl synthetase family protein [Saprospiraceae bacterium]|uniref:Polyprenyl synthetase family protein n=1 Tax=Candidatus Opimibacter skivensis TaxID=2982028 RepID=A0A9D7SYB3_9BACT|nr:polyprenyl synthetase family protein [Candidatus Opimibacter skivensis]
MSQLDYASLAKTFEIYLEDHQLKGDPDTLYAPIRYINRMGGKRIRPVFLLMAYNQWHEDISPALPAALALEYFHNFSLMHDDIMDEAALRRGIETVHIKFGRNLAILSGDAMLIKCFELLLEAGRKNNTGSAICSAMSSAALIICEGQQMDMDFEHFDSPSEKDYIEMIRRKTACLLGTCLKIGSLLAGASAEVADILYKYGENIGIAFQVRDDILDVFGDSKLTGKQTGGDILRGKKNFLYVHAYNSLSSSEQDNFTKAYTAASSTGDINFILEKYKSLNVETYANQIQQHYFKQAVESIDSLSFLNISTLKSFSNDLMSRDH